jgi:formate hydrogenlyase subunit 3/multisubunit Na+/H+ antiporter MnhD subunit
MVFPCFFLPLIIFLIISSFFSTKTLLASMLCVVGLFNGVISMAVLYNDFKKTVIKKLKITPLSPFNFTFGLITFNALTTIASIFLLFFIGIATYNKDINIKEIHFG